jgi:hypothetical protein
VLVSFSCFNPYQILINNNNNNNTHSYVSNINILSINVDAKELYFINVAKYSGVIINNIVLRLFVLVFMLAQPPKLNNEDSTTFAFAGNSLYPCGLYFNFYRDDV